MAVIKNNKILKCLLMIVVSLLLVLNFSIGVSASCGYDRQEADACITISQRLSVKGGNKSVDDIISGLPENTNGKGVARNFESTGGYEQTIKDFESLVLSDVKEIITKYGNGKVGKLGDGTIVVARPGSETGGATLEIRISRNKVIKIRY